MGRVRTRRGAALLTVLTALMLLALLTAALLAAAASDVTTALGHRLTISSFQAADGGLDEAWARLERVMKKVVPESVEGRQHVAMLTLGTVNGIDLLLEYGALEEHFVIVQRDVDRLVLGLGRQLEGGTYDTTVEVLWTGTRIDSELHGSRYAVTFDYLVDIRSLGRAGTAHRTLAASGEYALTVSRLSFARFMLFTDEHRSLDGQDVWFHSVHEFTGWVHTNDYFRIWENPKFYIGPLTQSGSRVKFYPNTMLASTASGSNYPLMYDERGELLGPDDHFFRLSFPRIDMPHQAFSQQWAALGEILVIDDPLEPPDPPTVADIRTRLAMGPGSTVPSDIYIAHDTVRVTGGLYIQGDLADLQFSLDGSDRQVITLVSAHAVSVMLDADPVLAYTYRWGWRDLYIFPTETPEAEYMQYYTNAAGWRWGWVSLTNTVQMPRTAVFTIDRAADQTRIEWRPVTAADAQLGKRGGNIQYRTEQGIPVATQVSDGIPNGVIYVDGAVGRADQLQGVRGTIGRQERMTLVAKGPIYISGSIRYQSPPDFDGDDDPNMFGMMSVSSDVVIHRQQTGDLDVHGVVMAPSGVYRVDWYDKGSPRGTVNHLGGVITKRYGAFAILGSDGRLRSGYVRNFTYDRRMMQDAPPAYPESRLLTVRAEGMLGPVLHD